MEKGRLKISELVLVSNSQPMSQHLRAPLFQTRDGDNVWSGDAVGFYVNGEHLPRVGTVSTLKGLRVDCFNTLLNKWEYYLLEP